MEYQTLEIRPTPDNTQTLSQSTCKTRSEDERPATKASESLWTCNICDITVISDYRKAHESGMWHMSRSRAPRWTCLICNLSMDASLQAGHEAGSKHCENRDRVLSGSRPGPLKEWICTVCKITIDEDSRVSHCRGQIHQMAALKLSVCSVCGATVAQKDQAAHEKNHRSKGSKSKKGKASRRAKDPPVKTWICTPCNVTVNTIFQSTHEASISHRKATGKPYPCEICGIVITSRFQASHEAARVHMAAINMDKSTYTNSPTPTHTVSRVSPKTKSTLPSIVPDRTPSQPQARESPTMVPAPLKVKPTPVVTRDPFDIALALKAQSIFEYEKHQRAQQPPLWTCTICKITINTEDRDDHKLSRAHRKTEKKAAKTWKCLTCEVQMRPEVREAHERSGQHTAQLSKLEAAANQ